MQYDEQSLYTRMTARYQELAGFVPDEASDIALRFHALAGELAQVCAVLDEARRQAAPQTAAGERLELYAGLRGLERIAAAHASGTLVFKRYKTGGEEMVPAGTLCLAADQTAYLTLEDAAFGDGGQPGAGLTGDPLLRPLLQGGDQGVLGELLGQADVADHTGENGDQTGRLDTPDRLHLGCDIGVAHGNIRAPP